MVGPGEGTEPVGPPTATWTGEKGQTLLKASFGRQGPGVLLSLGWDMRPRRSRAGSRLETRDEAAHCCTCFY